jgi:hypothetical protein
VRSAPPGLLQKIDRIILEILCKLVTRMRASNCKPSEMNTIANLLAKIGGSPVDRLKLNLEPPLDQSEKSAWDELDELD